MDSFILLDANGVVPADPLADVVLTSLAGVNVIVHADGTYEYDPMTSFDHLAEGEITNDSFDYQIQLINSFDGSPGDIQTASVHIVITGQNDAPTAAVMADQIVGEDAMVDANGAALTHSILISEILQSVTEVDDTTGFDLVNFSAAGLTLNKSLDGLSLEIMVNDAAAVDALNTGELSTFVINVDVSGLLCKSSG